MRGKPLPPPIRYVFREETPLSIKGAAFADPQVIGEELDRIAAANAGKLTPKATVAAAADPANPLHPHFEWDDARAAHAHRLHQARHLISLVRIVDDERHHDPPAFLTLADGARGTSYRPLAAVLKSADLQLTVLRQAEADLTAFERRYRMLYEVCDLIREARERVSERRVAAESERRPQA
jgi:hypothetical protein